MVRCPNCNYTKDQIDPMFCLVCGTVMLPDKPVIKKEKKEKETWQRSTEKTEQ